jgi:hypothetical protein
VFLIIVNKGQALPLVFTRFLCPRSSRGEPAERTRDMNRSRPQPRKFRERELIQNRPQSRLIHVREQSMSAFNPPPQSRPQTVRIPECIVSSTGRDQALAMDTDCPQPVRSLELSAAANSSRTRTFRKRGLEKNCPSRSILVSIWLPTSFPVRIRIIPSYDHI